MERNQAKRLPPQPTNKVIDALGGSAEVSRICEVTISAVSQWKSMGMPKARFMFLRERNRDLPVMKELRNF
mgnify:CR=1 FL=1